MIGLGTRPFPGIPMMSRPLCETTDRRQDRAGSLLRICHQR